MLIWRTVFFIIVLFSVLFYIQNYQTLLIDTDLNDVAPAISIKANLKDSLDNVSSSVAKRMVFLLASQDVKALENAYEVLATGIESIQGLNVSSQEDSGEALLDILKIHRYQLLTVEQKTLLKANDQTAIAEQAYARLFGLGSATGLLPFSEDPLGWFTDKVSSVVEGFTQKSSETSMSDSPLLGENQNIIALAAVIDNSGFDISKQNLLLLELSQLEASIVNQFDVKIFKSGVFFFASDAATKAKTDISRIGVLSLIGMLGVLTYVFRSLTRVLLPFLSIFVGVAVAFSVTHILFGSVHVLTLLLGVSLIGIVVDYAIHYCFHIDGRKTISSNKYLYRAMLLSLLTSLVGFAALGLSDLLALHKLAVFACCGLFVAWLTVISLAPWLLSGAQSMRQPAWTVALRNTEGLFARISHPFIIVLALTLFVLYLFWLVYGDEGSDDPRQFISPAPALLASERVVSAVLNDTEPGNFLVVEGKDANQMYKRFSQWKGLLSQSEGFDSIFEFLPAPGDQLKNYLLQENLYQESGAIRRLTNQLEIDEEVYERLKAEFLAAKQRVLQPSEVLTRFDAPISLLWQESGNYNYCIVLIPKGRDVSKLSAAAEQVEGITYINSVVLAKMALSEQRRAASWMLLAAYVLISSILVMRFRKINSLLMLLVPLAATVSTVLILSAVGQPLNLFHVMALYLVLGLGMDYVIFSREMPSNELTSQAIFLSAVTTVFSFGLLAISQIPVVHAFGITLLIGNTLNFIFALLFLVWCRRKIVGNSYA